MKIIVSGTLQRFTNYQREHVCDASTLRSGLENLVERHPDLAPVLWDRSGQLRGAHCIYVNDEQVAHGDIDVSVADDDRVEIITAIAGG